MLKKYAFLNEIEAGLTQGIIYECIDEYPLNITRNWINTGNSCYLHYVLMKILRSHACQRPNVLFRKLRPTTKEVCTPIVA